jgi:hypothetical protein
MQPKLEEFQISDKLVNMFVEKLQIFKNANLSCKDQTFTENGFQTDNILNYEHSRELADKLLREINKNLDLFHIHLIEYFTNGHQSGHNHKTTEDYSFILYLNDSDGNTVFKELSEIKPQKGKLIFFESDLWHYGRPSTMNKKVAVGALKKH